MQTVVRSRGPLDAGGLTERQRAVLKCVEESVAMRGYAPSMREVALKVGLSSASSVKHQLQQLERKGFLRRDPNRPRAIELIDPDANTPQTLRTLQESEAPPRYVPLVGRIAAGTPILAEQMVEGLYPFPREVVGQGQIFMLRVHGDSMMDAGILDGDLVVIRRQATAENGQIVAALVDDEATVKVWSTNDGRVELLPRNPAYRPIPGHKARILGRVVTVIRQL